MKKALIICTGASGCGKSYFVEHYLPAPAFYKLRSMTTRQMRPGEQNGREYFFVNEAEFFNHARATTLWVNAPKTPKWLYGVPEKEVMAHTHQNLVYDVIQPKYARQMHDWFVAHKLTQEYQIKTLWFLPPENNMEIARSRANMPDDLVVRTKNTCNEMDFLRAGITPDYFVKCSANETIILPALAKYIERLIKQYQK